MNKIQKIIVIIFITGLSAWILDAAASYIFFHKGTLISLLVPDMAQFGFHIRTVFMVVLLVVSIILIGSLIIIRHMQARSKAALKEKEVLIREIHHRVKNNFQVVCSLLSLQSQHIKDKATLGMFMEIQDRIRSLSLIHQKLHQSEDAEKINAAEYIKDLAEGLYWSYKTGPEKIELEVNVEDLDLGVNTIVPCGLIINELVSNAMKYAFPPSFKEKCKIAISMGKLENKEIVLMVQDNGIGISEKLDLRTTSSFGLELVKILVEDQLDGVISLDRREGTRVQIRFRGHEYRNET